MENLIHANNAKDDSPKFKIEKQYEEEKQRRLQNNDYHSLQKFKTTSNSVKKMQRGSARSGKENQPRNVNQDKVVIRDKKFGK